ncbi:hypothetical protein [Streptococcus himalayensis]|uniref:hypothetical protein n=1 Tax=Streptococcus himalayensis TaxID=1888195 RepID=UPI00083E0167|nr:hypothetical protein [Streptococcus himalayensis]
MEEIRKAQRSYFFWVIIMILYVIVGLGLFCLYPADIVSMMILLYFIIPAWPLLLYFLIGLCIYMALQTASERFDKVHRL